MKTNTPKNTAVQIASLITLYVSVTSFLIVAFGIITIYLNDVLDSWQYSSAQSSIRFSLATLIVFFPAYLVTMRMVQKVRREEDGHYNTFTKWLIYLSLVVGGMVFLGDIVAVLYSFLNGELTTSFLLKAAILALVIAGTSFYYVRDAKEYWHTREKASIVYGVIVSLLVAFVIVVGYLSLDTPSEVREQRIDEEQVQTLERMQYEIEDYYLTHKTLPIDFSDFTTAEASTAPERRAAYVYRVVDETTYELCATFAQPSRNEISTYSDGREYVWNHEAGKKCFRRVVYGKIIQ